MNIHLILMNGQLANFDLDLDDDYLSSSTENITQYKAICLINVKFDEGILLEEIVCARTLITL